MGFVLHTGPQPPRGAGFRIVRVLGSGGFGITYEAEWVPFGVAVAVKEYLPSGIAGRSLDGIAIAAQRGTVAEHYRYGLKSFEEEAHTLLQFKEPAIVRVLNFFEANGTAYLVMEYEAGNTLAQLLEQHSRLPEEELEGILVRTLDGLHAIHEKGYLHRDIKPSNVLVRSDGRPLLIDFGAARQALGQKTQTMSVILTPGYAPFEQYLSRGKQGAWTDLYALGATLYRCISGDAHIESFSAADRVAALQAGESDPLTPAVNVGAAHYSLKFLQTLDWMLQVRAADRPQAARDVQRRLLETRQPNSPSVGANMALETTPTSHLEALPHVENERLASTSARSAGFVPVELPRDSRMSRESQSLHLEAAGHGTPPSPAASALSEPRITPTADPPGTAEMDAEADPSYRAAIGPERTDYYIRHFIRFDTQQPTRRFSWNWSAFFFGPAWLFFREMRVYGLIYFVLAHWFFPVTVAILKVLYPKAFLVPVTLGGLAVMSAFAGCANALYHYSVRRRIKAASAHTRTLDETLENLRERPPTSPLLAAIIFVAWVLIWGFVARISAAL